MFVKWLIVLIALLIFFVCIWRTKQSKLSIKAAQRLGGESKYVPLSNIDTSKPEPDFVEEKVIAVPPELSSFELLSSEIDDNKQAELINITQCYRKPHPLLIPLLRTSFDSKELYEIVKSDPEFCAKILKTVNSSLFSLSKEITNINHAIVFLGAVQVKSIALQLATKNELEFSDKIQNDAYNNIWSASFIASNICFLLAKHLGKDNSTELSTYCLLSYLGDQALLSYQPSLAKDYLDDTSLFQRVNDTQNNLSSHSAMVGQVLAEQWQLPKVVTQAIGKNLLPLVDLNQAHDIAEDELRDILLCYISCRLGDLVVFHGLRDIANMSQMDGELGVEFQFIPDNLKQLGFEQVNDVLRNPEFILKINKQIAQTFGNE